MTPKHKHWTTTEVIGALAIIDQTISALKKAQAKELGIELSKIWRSEGSEDGNNFGLSAAGVARQIGLEYNLPGDFDE